MTRLLTKKQINYWLEWLQTDGHNTLNNEAARCVFMDLCTAEKEIKRLKRVLARLEDDHD